MSVVALPRAEVLLPDPDSPEYLEAQRSGATRTILAKDLAESNFHGLRRLEAYTMAGWEKRNAFTRELARGKTIDGCPFPFEVALLRALQMGMARFGGAGESLPAQAAAFMSTLRFGVLAPHLKSVIEYEPEVFFRAFQGLEVHRDVDFLEETEDSRITLDWMDFRIYQIPSLEKDLIWDLYLMDRSPWANVRKAKEIKDGAERVSDRPMPVMVGRKRNRDPKRTDVITLSMGGPGSSLHLTIAKGSPSEIQTILPGLAGERIVTPNGLGRTPTELRETDAWLVVAYQPRPQLADRFFNEKEE